MITAEQIMSGGLPTSKREFDVPGVGKILLHRLPAIDETEARQLFSNQEADTKELEKLAQRNTYFMLFGKFNDKEAKKLPKQMDVSQLAMIHTTGLFYTNMSQDNLEQLEKN